MSRFAKDEKSNRFNLEVRSDRVTFFILCFQIVDGNCSVTIDLRQRLLSLTTSKTLLKMSLLSEFHERKVYRNFFIAGLDGNTL